MQRLSCGLSLKAPAKINLTLEISALLPGGYHELDTIFQKLELADDLVLAKAADTELIMSGTGESGMEVASGSDNLVIKAQKALEEFTGRRLACRFELRKKIPAGGGLGGGSADCAAALKGLNELYNLGLDHMELHSLAASLGADVAFGLEGCTARGKGRGDKLSSLPAPEFLKDWNVLLLMPSYGLSTPEVYKTWDRLEESLRTPACGTSEELAGYLQKAASEYGLEQDSAKTATELCRLLRNDLYPAAASLRPELLDAAKAMEEAGCTPAMLCGSGSTMFGLLSPGNFSNLNESPEKLHRLEEFGRCCFTKLAMGETK